MHYHKYKAKQEYSMILTSSELDMTNKLKILKNQSLSIRSIIMIHLFFTVNKC